MPAVLSKHRTMWFKTDNGVLAMFAQVTVLSMCKYRINSAPLSTDMRLTHGKDLYLNKEI